MCIPSRPSFGKNTGGLKCLTGFAISFRVLTYLTYCVLYFLFKINLSCVIIKTCDTDLRSRIRFRILRFPLTFSTLLSDFAISSCSVKLRLFLLFLSAFFTPSAGLFFFSKLALLFTNSNFFGSCGSIKRDNKLDL